MAEPNTLRASAISPSVSRRSPPTGQTGSASVSLGVPSALVARGADVGREADLVTTDESQRHFGRAAGGDGIGDIVDHHVQPGGLELELAVRRNVDLEDFVHRGLVVPGAHLVE